MRTVLLACLGACGWLPADSPAQKPAVPAVDTFQAELVHPWKVHGHVLAKSTSLSEADADAMTGRSVDVTATGYTSPWQGTCEDASRVRRNRVLADIAGDLDLSAAGRATAAQRGFDGPLVEYKLTCNDSSRTPPLIVYVAGAHAMTCFAGICYFLDR